MKKTPRLPVPRSATLAAMASLTTLLTLLLAGCAGFPHDTSRRAPRTLAADSVGAAIGSSVREPWPEQRWWKSFGDPQLDRLMDRALAGSPLIAAADARIRQARGFVQVANAALLPSIEGALDSEYTRFSRDFYFPPAIDGHNLFDGMIWNTSVGAQLSYRLDFWGRDAAVLKAARSRVEIAHYEAQDARLAIEGALFTAYASLSYTYELQDNGQSILADEQHTLDLAKKRQAGGLGTEMEVQQASTHVSDTQGELEQLRNRLVLLRAEIAALCGDGPAAGESITRPTLVLPAGDVGLPATLPAELLGHRPDVLARRAAVEVAGQGVKVAETAFYPDVDLKAAIGFLGLGFGRLVSGDAIQGTVGPAITLPIFEAGRLRGELSARQAAYDQSVADYDGTLIHALREVNDQLEQYRSLATLRARRQETLAFARRAHELALSAFRAGLTDFLNVLQTESDVSRAENQLARVSFEQLVTVSALDTALGGGMPAAADAAQTAVTTGTAVTGSPAGNP